MGSPIHGYDEKQATRATSSSRNGWARFLVT